MNPAPARSRAVRAAFPTFLGAIAALGLAPFDAWWASLAAIAAMSWLFQRTANAREAGWLGWFFGLGYFAVGLMWIVEPFLVDAAKHGWLAPFGLAFTAGGMALFWGAGFWAGHRLGRGPVSRTVGLIVAWSLVEFGRAYLLTGFPWGAVAQIWTMTDAALLLAYVGPHGLALWTIAAVLPLSLLTGAGSLRWLSLAPGAGLLSAVLLAGQAAAPVTWTGKTIRLIQPNAPQHLKWHPQHVWTFFRRQLALTSGNAAEPVDLIIWPETSIPPLLEHADGEIAAIAQAAGGVPVVAGVRRREGQRLYNSLVVLDTSGKIGATYDKHHLVPFGEYMPLGDLAARFGLYGIAAGQGDGYSPGPGPETISLPGLGLAVPLICYEAVFPQDVTGAPGRADLLLQITNDAWFGRWSGPYQHLAQARMRAIEHGLPVVRVANTGISAMIDPLGQIVGHLPLDTASALDVALPSPFPRTLYARTGDWPIFLLVLAAMSVMTARQIASRRAN